MLVLTRKQMQQVVITVPPSTEHTTIVVGIARIEPDHVRIGFTAPKSTNIARAEIRDLMPIEDTTLDCGSLGHLGDPEHAAAEALKEVRAEARKCPND